MLLILNYMDAKQLKQILTELCDNNAREISEATASTLNSDVNRQKSIFPQSIFSEPNSISRHYDEAEQIIGNRLEEVDKVIKESTSTITPSYGLQITQEVALQKKIERYDGIVESVEGKIRSKKILAIRLIGILGHERLNTLKISEADLVVAIIYIGMKFLASYGEGKKWSQDEYNKDLGLVNSCFEELGVLLASDGAFPKLFSEFLADDILLNSFYLKAYLIDNFTRIKTMLGSRANQQPLADFQYIKSNIHQLDASTNYFDYVIARHLNALMELYEEEIKNYSAIKKKLVAADMNDYNHVKETLKSAFQFYGVPMLEIYDREKTRGMVDSVPESFLGTSNTFVTKKLAVISEIRKYMDKKLGLLKLLLGLPAAIAHSQAGASPETTSENRKIPRALQSSRTNMVVLVMPDLNLAAGEAEYTGRLSSYLSRAYPDMFPSTKEESISTSVREIRACLKLDITNPGTNRTIPNRRNALQNILNNIAQLHKRYEPELARYSAAQKKLSEELVPTKEKIKMALAKVINAQKAEGKTKFIIDHRLTRAYQQITQTENVLRSIKISKEAANIHAQYNYCKEFIPLVEQQLSYIIRYYATLHQINERIKNQTGHSLEIFYLQENTLDRFRFLKEILGFIVFFMLNYSLLIAKDGSLRIDKNSKLFADKKKQPVDFYSLYATADIFPVLGPDGKLTETIIIRNADKTIKKIESQLIY